MNANEIVATDLPASPRVRRFADLQPNYERQGISHHEQMGATTGERIASGVVFTKDTEIEWKLWYDEVIICHAVKGRYEIEIDGTTNQLSPGDMIWLPAGSSVIYRTIGEATVFYAVTPADWQLHMPPELLHNP